jgi:tetratricopeptide (TPR) repeat protein
MILITFYRNNLVNDLSRVITLCAAIALAGCAEEDPQQYLNEGKALVEKGEIKSARVLFKNALQIQPKFAKAYYELALLDEKNQDWAAMRRNLQDVVMLDPKHVDALVKLGLAHRLAGQLD